MPFSVESRGDIPILTIDGKVRSNDVNCLKEKLQKIIALQKLFFVIDLLNATSLNIDALAQIIKTIKRLRELGGDVSIVLKKEENERIYTAIVAAGLDEWLTLADSVEEVVGQLDEVA